MFIVLNVNISPHRSKLLRVNINKFCRNERFNVFWFYHTVKSLMSISERFSFLLMPFYSDSPRQHKLCATNCVVRISWQPHTRYTLYSLYLYRGEMCQNFLLEIEQRVAVDDDGINSVGCWWTIQIFNCVGCSAEYPTLFCYFGHRRTDIQNETWIVPFTLLFSSAFVFVVCGSIELHLDSRVN